ncbi:hypothetical protein FA13DRAFT_1085506 [Coprinellus micaceus]|uniref:Uncharacterized protein n=1 Tax=Coprinellus micaceus TaxID=71717 RepID=A0A4Y7TRK0_COPMI|nr:hypothetical protein FA13DRAFT_1085506 [Coprinellus micaceus]
MAFHPRGSTRRTKSLKPLPAVTHCFFPDLLQLLGFHDNLFNSFTSTSVNSGASDCMSSRSLGRIYSQGQEGHVRISSALRTRSVVFSIWHLHRGRSTRVSGQPHSVSSALGAYSNPWAPGTVDRTQKANHRLNQPSAHSQCSSTLSYCWMALRQYAGF